MLNDMALIEDIRDLHFMACWLIVTYLRLIFEMKMKINSNLTVDKKFLAINFFLPSSSLPNTNDSNVVKCYCFVGYR